MKVSPSKTALNSASDIAALLLEHPRSNDRWIGLEVERFAVGPRAQILQYEPDIEALMLELSKAGWKIDYEVDGKILGLSKDFHQITLEPGSQFEVGLAPQKSVIEVKNSQEQIDRYLKQLRPQWKFWGVGLNPWDKIEDRKLLPSPRYALMSRRFESTRGREMMRLTCGLQINLDFSTELEGLQMIRCGFLIAPYLSALFANSPYEFSKRSAFLSERAKIWERTDDVRSGIPGLIWTENFSLESYAEHIAQIPLMCAYDQEGHVFDPKGASFNDLPKDLRMPNALGALRQIFTEVRFKPCCVELRFLDQVPAVLRYAATAMAVGLLYDEKNRAEILREIGEAQSLPALLAEAASKALHSDRLYQRLCKLVKSAERGLLERKMGEEKFLAPIENLLSTRMSPAEKLAQIMGEQPQRGQLDELLARPEFAD